MTFKIVLVHRNKEYPVAQVSLWTQAINVIDTLLSDHFLKQAEASVKAVKKYPQLYKAKLLWLTRLQHARKAGMGEGIKLYEVIALDADGNEII